jgi:DNA-binding SARP family transcriptional activator
MAHTAHICVLEQLPARDEGDLRSWAIDDVLDAALTGTGAEAAEIFFREQTADGLTLAGFRGLYPEAFHQVTHFAVGEGYPGLVVGQGRPLVVNDTEGDSRFLRSQVAEAGFQHFVCVPIPGRKRPMGTLCVAWRLGNHDSESVCMTLSREAERLALILNEQERNLLAGEGRPCCEDARGSRKLVLHLLGGFEAHLGDVPLNMDQFARRRSLLLLKLLVTYYGKVVGRDELIELFWPSGPPDDARQLLKSAAHYLRRALGEAHDEHVEMPFISTVANGYAFNATSSHWIDAVEFKRLAEEGLRFERQGRWREAIVALEAAAELYTGDYLQDEPYADWAMRPRRQLRDLFLDVLQTTARLLNSAGDYKTAITCYRRVLDIDPCLEEAHRDLMDVLARCGRRTQALRQFETCRRVLKEEFNSSPLLETEALYRSILSGHAG